MKSLDQHNVDVQAVQRQLIDSLHTHPSQKLALLRTKQQNHCNHSLQYKINSSLIDISMLNEVVLIDREKSIALIEPLITMSNCCMALLPLGYTIPVVPELKGITLGGAIAGLGGESSSHRYGAVHDCCIAYEVLLGDGTLLTINAENEYRDLFYALPGSFGTLAILVGVWIKLIPAQPYVLVDVALHDDATQFIANLKTHFNKVDFVEGISYSPTHNATIIANMCKDNKGPYPTYSMYHYWCPWFYRYVEDAIKYDQKIFYMTLYDYYFRHSKSKFWLLKYKISDHYLSRILFGWINDLNFIKNIYKSRNIDEREKVRMIQDIVLPFSNLERMLNDVNKLLDIHPLWFMPMLNTKKPDLFWSDVVKDEEYFSDIGIYGKFSKENIDPVVVNRMIENLVHHYHGLKILFARCYYTEAEFWDIFDKSRYDALREKYRATKAFHNIYKKISS